MAITVIEDPESRHTTIGSPESCQTRTYTVEGTTNHGEALAALRDPANVPGFVDPYEEVPGWAGLVWLPRREIDVTPLPAFGSWRGRVAYSSFTPNEFAFDIGGGTEHIVINDRGPTFAYSPLGTTAPDMKGRVGVNWNNDTLNIEGCDVPPGDLSVQFTRKQLFASSEITKAYLGTLVALRHAVNNAEFYGLEAGEALFLGACGRPLGDFTWELMFRWAGSPNRKNLGIPFKEPVITGIDKQGWDYLWVLYKEGEKESWQTPDPIAVYVEQLLPRGDFGELKIGTTW